ncbi:MAG TPA: DUF445 domain-containing protein [Actinophytocola sp.]|uniref:DUF445 domain-containing protein n=1 Tax=Actinophytocola sp. TaxID=1872138 RepID=UPI002DDD56DF|nr:DUF445 domain-containing protein [Actinophytocola sp.]HEV2783257.1 DUF445 domain-containing protein [Actinophytocola sp.]
MNAMLADLGSHWAVYASMPFIAAIIGYVTKLAAIQMMFRPIRFVGIAEPFLGWQGVVPRNSERMIRISAELLTTRLVDPKEVFAKLDPDRVAKEIEGPLLLAVDEVAREVLERYHPALWEMLPTLAQDLIVKQVQAGSPALVRRIMTEIRENVTDVLDVKQVAVSALERDKELLIRLIRDISRPEMAFIARCGIYFGFILGLVQTAVWAATHEPLVLPVFGAAIGLLTDWLAIKLVFFPRERTRILGLVPFQGIFQRRRDEVARQYGELVAREVMTVPNLVDGILRGPGSDRLITMIQRIVQRTIDEQASVAKPLVSVAIGARRFQQMKHAAADKAMTYLSSTAMHAKDYAADAMDVADTIAARMRRLSRVEYERLLRPAFRQDEWKLITVGAVIGALVGELQVVLLLG